MNVLSFQNENKTSCRLALAALSLLALASTGCLSKSGDATPVQVRASAATIITKGAEHAFQTSFYAFARTNCAGCHSTMQAPYFAESNIDLAYDAARNPAYINFNDLPFSLYAVRSGDGHCGSSSCTGLSDKAIQALKPWAEAELAAGGADGPPLPSEATLFTTTLAIPAGAATVTGVNFVPMRWNLGPAASAYAPAANAIFELSIQKFGADTYRIKSPRIVGLTAATTVRGIHIYVRRSGGSGIGNEQIPATDWAGANSVALIAAKPNTLPATPFAVGNVLDLDAMIITRLSPEDSITVGFDSLALAPAVPPTFAQINTTILTPKCVSCHGNTNPARGINLSTYAGVFARVSPGNARASQLYQTVAIPVPGASRVAMPPAPAPVLTSAELDSLAAWISNNAPNN